MHGHMNVKFSTELFYTSYDNTTQYFENGCKRISTYYFYSYYCHK